MLSPQNKLRTFITAVLCTALAVLSVAGTSAFAADPTDPATEQYRPYLHFSPTKNWMNDPNGLVFYKGVYHLFYQYNPFGNTWGNMSWGHATSTDLLHWTEQPLAIPQDADADIFSGSIVVDHDNTSGFGTAENPPLVAMYTSAYHTGKQAQSLAYSTDAGQTWTKYAGNPVLDRNSNNFRDPHMFWYNGGSPASSYWVVVTVEANDHQVLIYKSNDLKTWTALSTFGPANAVGGQWECPDLFPIAVDGDPNNIKWVMVVNVNPGAVGGGSGGQYFVGDFDGTTFTSDSTVGSDTLPAGSTLAGFDDGTYNGWTVNNEPGNQKNGPFGNAPAAGALDGQSPVSGFSGTGLINSFNDHDWPMGSIQSPDFTINQNYVNFLVGGGNHPWQEGTSTKGVDPDGTVINDFESTGWGDWTATGDLAGAGPTTGATSGQSAVTGFQGSRLLNTFLAGDATTGTLTSPPFTISSPAIDFMIAGGNHPWGQANPTALNLVIGGQVVRTATGNDSETPAWQGWDLTGLQGQQATLQAVDNNTGGFGHLLLDQITVADHPTSTFADFENTTGQLPTGWTADGDFATSGVNTENLDANSQQGLNVLDTCTVPGKCDTATGTFYSPQFTITQDYINFLMAGGTHPWGGTDPAAVKLVVNGQVVKTATGNGTGFMNWNAWDVSALIGQTAQIQVADLHSGGDFGHIMVDDFTFSGTPALPRSTATAVNLVVNGAVVRTATGKNSEDLDWASWNVSEFVGQHAHISVVDNNRGGWGHVLADQFMVSDTAAQSRTQSYDWLDWGRDFYAGVTYDNAPDNKRIMIAWMNNWDYANQIPTGQWRSAMALPRELALQTIDGRPQLVQKVVDQIGALTTPASYTAGPSSIPAGSTALPAQADGNVTKIDAVFSPGTATTFGLTVRQSADNSEGTPVLYDTTTGRLTVDRTQSGDVSFNPTFSSIESAPVRLENGKLHLELYLDRSSIEVFAQNGKRTITDQVFPKDTSNGISLVSRGGTAHVESLTVTPLQAAMWKLPKAQTITFDPLVQRTAGDPDFTVTANASSGLPVTFTATGVCAVTGVTVHLTGAGSCTIAAAQAGNADYTAAAPVTQTFTVVPAVLDTFNRANGAVGTNWAGATTTSFYKIAGNALDVQAGGPMIWKTKFGTTQEASVQLTTIDPKSPSQGVLLKVQANRIATSGAISVVYDATRKAVRVSTLRVGAWAWTPYANFPVTFVNGDVLGARVLASGEVQISKNGALVTKVTLNGTDKQFFNTKGGYLGIWSAAARNAVLDDFRGGTVG